jgi:hypothetical protein
MLALGLSSCALGLGLFIESEDESKKVALA